MASRTKKDASDALEKLKDYLRRDRGGMNLLESIVRYLGELRHERAKINSDNDRLRTESLSLSVKMQRLESQVTSLREQLSAESSRRRQAESATASERYQLQELERKLAPPELGDGATLDEGTLGRLIKDMARRMPKPPSPASCIAYSGGRMDVFDLDDFVPKLADDEFMALGKFVVLVVASVADGVAFTFDRSDHRNRFRNMSKAFRNGSKGQKLNRWIRNWIAPGEEYKNSLLDVQNLAHAVVSGQLVEAPKYMPLKD
jgi:hypothetical protein